MKKLILLGLMIVLSVNLNAAIIEENKKACDEGEADGCKNYSILNRR